MAEMNQIGPSTVAAVPHPIFVVIYEKKDITADITPYVQEVTYTDYLSGQSDEISIRLEDVDGRWMDAWYPGKTDALHLKFGYEGKPLLACGPFEIDEIEFDLTPSVVTIKALSTGVKSPSRTKSGRAYENTTLAAIAQRIAKRLKLTLTGKIRDIPIDRVTQYRETDVGFLTRLAREYGYAFKVVGTKLVFTEQADLRAASAVLTLSRSDLRPGGRLRDKVKDIYANAKLKHQDTKTKSLIVYGVKDDAVAQVGTTTVSTSKKKASGQGASGDTLYVSARANNKGAAQVKAQAALDAANNEQTAGSLPFIGDIRLVAGVVVALDKTFGKLAGNYLIESGRHVISRGGYTADVEVKRTAPATASGTTKKATAKGGLKVYGVKDNQVQVVGTSSIAKKK